MLHFISLARYSFWYESTPRGAFAMRLYPPEVERTNLICATIWPQQKSAIDLRQTSLFFARGAAVLEI
ncbi:MAG: hypothetical protein NXI22_02040 [bacterium]|nr:hypothetical protein [bacterium]